MKVSISRILTIMTLAAFLICNVIPVYAEPSGYPGGDKGRIYLRGPLAEDR